MRAIAVLDRTKEPGAIGEPLYQDVVTALAEARNAGRIARAPRVVGGRYGLSSKEFTPAMVTAVFDEPRGRDAAQPLHRRHRRRRHAHVASRGDTDFDIEPDAMVARASSSASGSDGTVGANKNSIKIIGEETDDARAGLLRLRLEEVGRRSRSRTCASGPGRSARPTWSARRASSPATSSSSSTATTCSSTPAEGADFLLNSPYGAGEVWDRLPREVQEQIIEKRLKLYVIDAYRLARETGLKGRINTIMQTCFFAISGVLPRETRSRRSRRRSRRPTARRARDVLKRNFAAVDRALAALAAVAVPAAATARAPAARRRLAGEPPDFVQRVTAVDDRRTRATCCRSRAFPVDGTWPAGTSQWEKRNIAAEIPVWDPALCIQCNKCALVCPHAAIRAKVYEPALLDKAPADVQVRRLPRGRLSRAASTRSRSRPRTAPAARSA